MRTTFLCCILVTALGIQELRPGVFRTPEERFENLPGFEFQPHYTEILGYRVHYLDEGPRDGQPVLLLHGEPTWSYLYRKMMPLLAKAGVRAIAPDLIGFGRSDKPADMDVHTYAFHVDAMSRFVTNLDLRQATFFGQDWGGLIGLRVVAENAERFAAVVVSNTALPVGTGKPSPAFEEWKRQNAAMIERGDMPVGRLVAGFTDDPSLAAPYDAPFPDARYKAGPLILPQRVPVSPDDPAREANLAAWAVFRKWEKPFVTAFGDSDPITAGLERPFQEQIPGAKGQPHRTIQGAGHFIQETHAPELAEIIINVVKSLPPRASARASARLILDLPHGSTRADWPVRGGTRDRARRYGARLPRPGP
jgi:haloalkane dehalogenase